MKKHLTQFALCCASIACLAMFTGCSPAQSQPAFKACSTPPAGKALVYIYRPKCFTGSANSWTVYHNSEPICGLYNGSYYSYIVNPEEVSYAVRNKLHAFNVGLLHLALGNPAAEIAKIKFEPNNTYYVKFRYDFKMDITDPVIAGSEITKCHLAETPYHDKIK